MILETKKKSFYFNLETIICVHFRKFNFERQDKKQQQKKQTGGVGAKSLNKGRPEIQIKTVFINHVFMQECFGC